MKLVIGNKNYSSWSLRPWLLLAHHGIPFEEERIPLDTEAMPALMARHTEAGKVPVLCDGDLWVWDSLAICEYLSERNLAGKGWPADVKARARARACAAEMHSGFFSLRGQMPMNCRATGRAVELTAELRNDITRIDAIWSKWRNNYASQGPWLFGEFSIADCMFAPVAFRFRTYGIALSPESEAYMASLLAHPQMERWLADGVAETEVIAAAEVGEVMPAMGIAGISLYCTLRYEKQVFPRVTGRISPNSHDLAGKSEIPRAYLTIGGCKADWYPLLMTMADRAWGKM